MLEKKGSKTLQNKWKLIHTRARINLTERAGVEKLFRVRVPFGFSNFFDWKFAKKSTQTRWVSCRCVCGCKLKRSGNRPTPTFQGTIPEIAPVGKSVTGKPETVASTLAAHSCIEKKKRGGLSARKRKSSNHSAEPLSRCFPGFGLSIKCAECCVHLCVCVLGWLPVICSTVWMRFFFIEVKVHWYGGCTFVHV